MKKMRFRFLQVAALVWFASLLSTAVMAQQAYFVESGEIIFEKRINMYSRISRQVKAGSTFAEQAYESYRKNNPQFSTVERTLLFRGDKSIYKASGKNQSLPRSFFDDPLIQVDGPVYMDLTADRLVSQRTYSGENFLVSDSLHAIDWKITDEIREIAGFTCRRANALVLDSVYIVAFYTEQIPVSGGPESISGLPGMILGLAMPHENITWFATKVVDRPVQAKEIVAPSKGKAVDRKGLWDLLQTTFRSWEGYAPKIYQAILL